MFWKFAAGGVAVVLLALVVGSLRHGGLGEVAQNSEDAGVVCPDPLVLASPVDLSKATSILYPGQVRGGDFKRHGGFRFDTAPTNQVGVTAPLEATLTAASRYIEWGEVQYLLDFETVCGVRYRFDHLLVLAPKFAAAAETLPLAKEDDSRTTSISGDVRVTQGEIIATAVGVKDNVFVDFGVYDTTESSFLENPQSNPLCWLDLLPVSEAARVKSLPAADSQSGKESEYCD